MKSLRIVLAALVFIGTFSADSVEAGNIFSDDFNRPDSLSVGNGWINSPGNNNGDFQILNGGG